MYGSVPSALPEAVANAWDDDAGYVSIRTTGDITTIEDDGCGMTLADANEKYLRVDYERYKEGAAGCQKEGPTWAARASESYCRSLSPTS